MPLSIADSWQTSRCEPTLWFLPPHLLFCNPPHPNSMFGKKIKCTEEPLKGINSLRNGRIKKIIFQYFLSQLNRWVIILYINCGHQWAATSMQGTETAFECTLSFHFHYRHSWSHGLCTTCHTFYKIRYLSVVLSICKSFAIVLLVISPYSVYVVSNIMCCAVTGNR